VSKVKTNTVGAATTPRRLTESSPEPGLAYAQSQAPALLSCTMADSSRPVLIDDRVGSAEFAPLLAHLPFCVRRLDYADFAFEGNGPYGPLMVGIERKTLPDLIQSIHSKRLSGHQIPGMLRDYGVVYLLVEGLYRGCPQTQVLQHWQGNGWKVFRIGRKGYAVSEVDNYLTSVESIAGVHLRWTPTRQATAQLVDNLWNWWGKPWHSHKSLQVVYSPQAAAGPLGFDDTEPTLIRRVVCQLPGVGITRSKDVAAKFTTLMEFCQWMVQAGPEDWQEFEGIGPALAERIFCTIHGIGVEG
jgi:ERCC4-type nuclease